jgi:hypothetical protein
MDHLKYLIVHDTRLTGQAKGFYAGLLTVQLNATTSLRTAFARINATANSIGKLKSLFLLCHGMAGGMGGMVWGNTTDDFWWRGGGGLLLGQEQVLSSNVNLWTAIRNQVETIVVYACGAAYTGPAPPFQMGNSDGQALMMALARHSNATVYAADKIQWYYPNNLDFGHWEGTVYMFPPTGGMWAGFPPMTEVTEVL